MSEHDDQYALHGLHALWEMAQQGDIRRNAERSQANARWAEEQIGDLCRRVQHLTRHVCAFIQIVSERLDIDDATWDRALERYAVTKDDDGICPKCGRPYGGNRTWCVFCGEDD